MRPLRILHIITRLERGGAPKVVLDTLARLDGRQYACSLATGLASSPQTDMLPSARALGIPVFVVPQLVRDVRPCKDVGALLKLIGLIQHGRYDLVHAHTCKAGFLGRLAARHCGVPSVLYSPHGTILQGYFGKTKTALFTTLDRVAARYTDRIICLTQHEIQQCLDAGIGRRHQYGFVYNGVDLAAYGARKRDRSAARVALGLADDDRVCVTVGRLVPVKGHRFLLEAVARAQAAVPGLKLLCAGEGPEDKELLRLADRLGLGQHIRFLGFRNDIAEILSACDVFVLPSLNEGLGLVLLEAMASGLPIVATRVGGVPEVVHEKVTGLLVPPRAAGALCDAVVSLFQRPEQMAQMGAKALARVQERFSIEAAVDKLERIYATCAKA